MDRARRGLWMLAALSLALSGTVGCKKKAEPPKQIDAFTCDSPDRLIGYDQASVDPEKPAEGAGSLIMIAEQPKTVSLFEVKDPGEGGAKFIVTFKMRVQGFDGNAYGQMNLNYASGGRQEVTNREAALGADSDWLPMTLAWTVQKGQKLSSLSLYAVLNGTGTAWVDDVKVTRAPLP